MVRMTTVLLDTILMWVTRGVCERKAYNYLVECNDETCNERENNKKIRIRKKKPE